MKNKIEIHLMIYQYFFYGNDNPRFERPGCS